MMLEDDRENSIHQLKTSLIPTVENLKQTDSAFEGGWQKLCGIRDLLQVGGNGGERAEEAFTNDAAKDLVEVLDRTLHYAEKYILGNTLMLGGPVPPIAELVERSAEELGRYIQDFHQDVAIAREAKLRMIDCGTCLQASQVMVIDLINITMDGPSPNASNLSIFVESVGFVSNRPDPQVLFVTAESKSRVFMRPSTRLIIKAPSADHMTIVIGLEELLLQMNDSGECVYPAVFTIDGHEHLQATIKITVDIVHPGPKYTELNIAELFVTPLSPGQARVPLHMCSPSEVTRSLKVFLSKYRGSSQIKPSLQVFLQWHLATLSCVSKILMYEPISQAKGIPTVAVPQAAISFLYGTMTQLGILLQLACSSNSAVELGKELLDEIVTTCCRCLKIVDSNIKMYQENVPFDDRQFCHIQKQLFRLTYAVVCQLHETHSSDNYDSQLDTQQIVKKILPFYYQEVERTRSPRTRSMDRCSRPYTTLLASLRGQEMDDAFEFILSNLKTDQDAKHRDLYRRALVRLVQSADRLPKSFIVTATVTSNALGHGSYAVVYPGTVAKNEGLVKVAIKVLNATDSQHGAVQLRRRMYIETVIWKTLEHSRLLPMFGVTRQSEQDFSPMCMVSQHMEKGTLKQCCHPQHTPASTRRRYIQEIVEGMVYLHGEDLAHGDLRSSNIFIEWDCHTNEGHIRIADFGLSILAEGMSQNYASTRAGNLRCLAPELLAPNQDPIQPVGEYLGESIRAEFAEEFDSAKPSGKRPTKASDVYTFACLCFELHTGKLPLSEKRDAEVLAMVTEKKQRADRPTKWTISSKAWDLIERCWHHDASQRPRFADMQTDVNDSKF